MDELKTQKKVEDTFRLKHDRVTQKLAQKLHKNMIELHNQYSVLSLFLSLMVIIIFLCFTCWHAAGNVLIRDLISCSFTCQGSSTRRQRRTFSIFESSCRLLISV